MIKQFWQSRIDLGTRNHTFDIIETGADGRYAFQVNSTSVQLARGNGERTPIRAIAFESSKGRTTGLGKPSFTCSIDRTDEGCA
jgi:hypothetical protein